MRKSAKRGNEERTPHDKYAKQIGREENNQGIMRVVMNKSNE